MEAIGLFEGKKEVEEKYIVTDKEVFLIDIRNKKGPRKLMRWVSLCRTPCHRYRFWSK